MKRLLRYLSVDVLQTLLRFVPFPSKTGLIRIGNPGRSSPVLLTASFRLTVERVQRALSGLDAYLLVANSRGVNVWCASTGGLLTNHDVVSVLKTSGIADLVDHRKVILPQLAAAGIESRVIREKTDWEVVWGPVDAADAATFIEAGLAKTPQAATARFRWPQRLEMAVAWAFPMSLLAILGFPLWRDELVALIGLIWGLSLLIFASFPLYEASLRAEREGTGRALRNVGPGGVAVVFWMLFMAVLVAWTSAAGSYSSELTVRWGLASLVVISILTVDLAGSTPVYKSGFREDRRLRITLNGDRCEGLGFCRQVCPTNVFEVDARRRLATIARGQRCVQCGACIVQCPLDALTFVSPNGDMVTPESIRKYKLNLLGKRLVRVDSEDLRAS